ncbi:MAG: hypothetical protein JOY62_05885 [Acidobacteriaceae bacterium]|nr:hypothetical protein [Acidobacteriaceae bacterium]MBV9779489.1 hypothetical protein [Acidobacteriaceae bacterium]
MQRPRVYFVPVFVLSCALLGAQQNGRFADLKSQGIGLFQGGKYSEAAGKLEAIWEEDQSDAKVAEYLAMAYLYGEHDAAKAQPVMEKAIANGGQASFLVFHSHERLAALHGDIINQYCAGKISVSPGKLVFISDSGEHSVTIDPAELKEFTVTGGAPGRISIKAAGKSYTFMAKTHSRAEAVLLATITQQNFTR